MKPRRRSPQPCSARLSPTLEALLSAPDAHLPALAAAVRQLSSWYVSTNRANFPTLFSRPELLAAYTRYYLPVNAIKLRHVLHELPTGWLGRRDRLRVIDIGCGPGSMLLGLLDHLDSGEMALPGRIELWGVDRDAAALSLARQLINQYLGQSRRLGRTAIELHCRVMRTEKGDLPAGGFDLLISGNLLNELPPAQQPRLAKTIVAALQPHDAVALLVEPGSRPAFRQLLALRGCLAALGLHVWAPCPRDRACPLATDPGAWCHETLRWRPPPLVSAIDRHLGFSKHKGVSFSYLMLRTQADSLADQLAAERDAIWRVISYAIRSKGQQRLVLCNGEQRVILQRLDRHATAANADFDRATRGDLVGCRPRVGRPVVPLGPEDRFTVLRAAQTTHSA